MGIDVDVFRLYGLPEKSEPLILAHAAWPEYPNWWGSGFDWASEILEASFQLLLIYARKRVETKNATLLGQSYSCTGGDIFYETCGKNYFKEVLLDIWVAHSMSDHKLFAFGIHSDEIEFWNELIDSTEWENHGPFSRPAQKKSVLYLR